MRQKPQTKSCLRQKACLTSCAMSLIFPKRLESIENDLKSAGMKESEVIEKLKLAEEQLEHQSKVLEKAIARNAELESSHEILTRDSEVKLQDAIANFTNRDSEAKGLHEKVEALEDQVNSYRKQLAEATERYETTKKELNGIVEKLTSSEDTNENLKRKIMETEGKAEEYAAENVILSETNAALSGKVKDLEEKLIAAASEMEVSNRQLDSHTSTITDLTERHSKVSELQLAAEARISEVEAQLEGAIQKFNLRDSEAKELYEKLKAFEAQDLERELEKNSSQFENETQALVETNLNLTQDLASYESKLSDLQTKLSVVSSEKHDTVEELNNARTEIEELMQRLASEGQKLQSQISSVMEENNLLNETFQSSKKDLEAMMVHLEEQLKEQKSSEDALKTKLETLNSEVGQKAELQNRLEDLEEQLATAETKLKEEKASGSDKDLEREAGWKHLSEELEAKKNEILLLENKVKELENRLQQTDAKLKERKHKKKTEPTSAEALSSDTTHVQTTEASSIVNLKIIVGVALVSIIFGIILGKRY
ncbi:hypothetical protein Sango_2499200 [Sesamum angolense]|uniref:Uncharacterized protein n=1 Tax=Sesamum angolense TaxID=2727404 RepID=A0AAE2BI81_9LAMI|nr:hypothetical protein Sango_2499200 [Sesamum angolense]